MSARTVIASAMSNRREQLTGEASPLDYDGARLVLTSLERNGFTVVPTEDGAATPPADQTGKQVLEHLGSGVAAESATGVASTGASLSSPAGPGPIATIGGQPGPGVPRMFQLYRHIDISYVSGVGVVAWGVQFPDGSVAVRWHGDYPSTVAWNSIADAIAVHGHSGATEVRWIDSLPERVCRICQCTDKAACFSGCYWVAPDLCSQCGPAGGE